MKKTKYVRKVFVIAAIIVCCDNKVCSGRKSGGIYQRREFIWEIKIPTDAELMKDLRAMPTFWKNFPMGMNFKNTEKNIGWLMR